MDECQPRYLTKTKRRSSSGLAPFFNCLRFSARRSLWEALTPTISKMGGVCHERITLNHHFVRRPLLPLLGLFTSVYAPTSIPPTVPESDIMVIDNKNP